MLRTQPLLRSLQSATRRPLAASPRFPVWVAQLNRSKLCSLSQKRPQCLSPAHKFSTSTGRQDVNVKEEVKSAAKTLIPTPETVSVTSSTHPILSEQQTPPSDDAVHTHGGISSDLKTIRETFNLSEVPREAFVIGVAGLVPYVATSMATIGVAYEINQAHEYGTGYFMQAHSAETLLHLLEPIQVGYGAVIISFLGAIHWGFEWAGYGGKVGYPRYAIGVLSPMLAWPSLLLPVTGALIVQFLAFNALYYIDSRSARRGWTPPWYGTYRFVLTFVVGASIVISLIGRGELIGKVGQLPSPAQRIRMLQEAQLENLRKEEEARRIELIAKGEASKATGESLDDGDDEEEKEEEDEEEEEEKGEDEDEQKDDKARPKKK